MKLRIKTEFWKETQPEEWKRRYNHLAYITLIQAMTIIGYGIFNESKFLVILGTTVAIMMTIIQITYNTYHNRLHRCTRPTLHNMKNTKEETKCKWCGKTNKQIKEEENTKTQEKTEETEGVQ